jgi:hypothetical protein
MRHQQGLHLAPPLPPAGESRPTLLNAANLQLLLRALRQAEAGQQEEAEAAWPHGLPTVLQSYVQVGAPGRPLPACPSAAAQACWPLPPAESCLTAGTLLPPPPPLQPAAGLRYVTTYLNDGAATSCSSFQRSYGVRYTPPLKDLQPIGEGWAGLGSWAGGLLKLLLAPGHQRVPLCACPATQRGWRPASPQDAGQARCSPTGSIPRALPTHRTAHPPARRRPPAGPDELEGLSEAAAARLQRDAAPAPEPLRARLAFATAQLVQYIQRAHDLVLAGGRLAWTPGCAARALGWAGWPCWAARRSRLQGSALGGACGSSSTGRAAGGTARLPLGPSHRPDHPHARGCPHHWLITPAALPCLQASPSSTSWARAGTCT